MEQRKRTSASTSPRPSDSTIASRLRGTGGFCFVRDADGLWFEVCHPRRKVEDVTALLQELMGL